MVQHLKHHMSEHSKYLRSNDVAEARDAQGVDVRRVNNVPEAAITGQEDKPLPRKAQRLHVDLTNGAVTKFLCRCQWRRGE